jgi:hypothetical protein
MRRPGKILAIAIAVVALVGVEASLARGHRRHAPSRKSPRVEILAVARVQSAPRKTVHPNRRAFEEFDVMILSARATPEQARGADRQIVVVRDRSVHIVHDLTCGGSWVDLTRGDEVEIEGEYVQPPNGADLIHFTHPADSSCGTGEPHPDGYLKRKTREP